jgi:hypothetical protein
MRLLTAVVGLMLLPGPRVPVAQAPRTDSSAAVEALRFPTKRKFKHNRRFLVEYDRTRDVTLVRVNVFHAPAPGSRPVWMDAIFAHPGRVLILAPRPIDEMIFFHLVTIGTPGGDLQWMARHDLELRLDDSVRVSLPGRYQYDITAEGHVQLEEVHVVVPVATFLRIIGASKVEGRIGTTDFVLKQNALEALRDLGSRMVPKSIPPNP